MAIISRTEDLEILLTVIDSGSFSAAARILDIQVAKVSRAVSRLEKDLDCTLLNRTTRKLELTEEGRIFTEQVRNGLHQLAEAEEKIRTLKGIPAGRLRVDAVTPLSCTSQSHWQQAFVSAIQRSSQNLQPMKISLI